MKTKSLRILTILAVLTLVAAVAVGCKDKNGVSYSDYPVAGKSYKTTSKDNPEIYYDIISFSKHNNTATYRSFWKDGKGKSNLYYTMSGDVIWLYYDAKQTDLLDSFIYNNTYLDRRGAGLTIYYLMEE